MSKKRSADDYREWIRNLQKRPFSADAPGCLLVLLSIAVGLGGAIVTGLWIRGLGAEVHGRPVLLALPAVGLGVLAFHGLGPLLFGLERSRGRQPTLPEPTADRVQPTAPAAMPSEQLLRRERAKQRVSVPDARRRPLRSRELGWLVYVTGATVFSGAIAVLIHLEVPTWQLAVGAALAALITRRLFALARRLTAVSAEQALANDKRPPIVFLRPHTHDGLSGSWHGLGWVNPALRASALLSLWDFLTGADEKSLEQVLARAFARTGPFVALGRPGDATSPPGAARTYTGDDDWRAEVVELLDSAQVVVWLAGDSEGIRWELQQIVARVRPGRVLLWIPNPEVRRRDYDALCAWANSVLPRPLPAHPPRRANLVRFDDDWQPHLWAFHETPEFLCALGFPATSMRRTLRPFLDALRRSNQRDAARGRQPFARSLPG